MKIGTKYKLVCIDGILIVKVRTHWDKVFLL